MDYVKHYLLLISSYYNINRKLLPRILVDEVNPYTVHGTIVEKTNFNSISKADVIVLGIVHHIVDGFKGSGDFKWVIQYIDGKKIMYLGCEFSIWGDITGRLAEMLLKNKGANTIIYVGKLGTLNKRIRPNVSLASGSSSYIEPSVIEETKEWFNTNKTKYDFVDSEIGQIAYYCKKNGANFGYLHMVSDNLNKNSIEDLSNERNVEILKKEIDFMNK